ncbi:tetratricopeptide repeat protein [Deinococcus pimensis]|uniref:tetratricopeptide repeat protein n=1 Tax=Deinococcus pimensis TaxID=309888 RepID=UPI000486A4B2|nr:tetratricopeptide repeat protein [Deinococcus pimensis]
MKRVLPLGLLAALSLGSIGRAQTATPPTTPGAPTQSEPARPTPNCASYVALGNSYYAQGQYDSAYVAFRAATECDPKSGTALLGFGRTQVRLKLYAPAVDTLTKLVALDPQNVSNHIALAQAYTQQYVGTSDRAAVAGNLDLALKALDRAEGVDPQSAAIYNQRGTVYRLKGDNAQALEMLRRAAILNPEDAVVLYNLGDLYNALGQLPQAVSTLQRAVVAAPQDAVARAYYGKLLLLNGNPDAARVELAQAERIAPRNAYVVGQFGVFGYLTKDNLLARVKLEQAVKLEPLRYPEFYYYLGRVALDAGRAKDARGDLTRAASLASTNPEYFYWLGRAQEASGDKGAARQAYGEALRLSPNMKLAQDGLNRVK